MAALKLFMAFALTGCTGIVSGGAGGEAGPGGPGQQLEGGGGSMSLDPSAPTPLAPQSPGSVVVRRLNRVEYDNTVRDLLGTELTLGQSFPADDPGAGFDTVGAAASLSPTYVRDYEASAHVLIDDLFADPTRFAKVVSCDVETEGTPCAESTLGSFARRAWRRPPTSEEIARLLAPLQAAATVGASATDGLRHALAAVLLSPHFIFKLEIDPSHDGTVRRLDNHELATRLSYALWSTMPDEALFTAADAGTLHTDAELEQQLSRLLADSRAAALARDFAGQWLDFRELEKHEVEPKLFPEYSAALAESMKREGELLFMDLVRSSRPLPELLTARYTYVDQSLATHYGLTAAANPDPSAMQVVDTSESSRTGLLTLGAVLTATSFPTRTSPVKRGEFVLRKLLCTSVPPPPPEVIGLEETMADTTGLTLRERLEAHRDKDACRGCHMMMDPLGFGLENYDAIGRYRTLDNGQPIDACGEQPDGVSFSGAIELAAMLAADDRLGACIAEKFMTFALGRFLTQADDATWVLHIAGTVRDAGGGFDGLVRTLVMSEMFRGRQSVVSG